MSHLQLSKRKWSCRLHEGFGTSLEWLVLWVKLVRLQFAWMLLYIDAYSTSLEDVSKAE